MNKQLTELLTNYGPVGAIWFDGIWDQPTNCNWQLEEQYALIHKLQPSCLIGNNHHRTPYAAVYYTHLWLELRRAWHP